MRKNIVSITHHLSNKIIQLNAYTLENIKRVLLKIEWVKTGQKTKDSYRRAFCILRTLFSFLTELLSSYIFKREYIRAC